MIEENEEEKVETLEAVELIDREPTKMIKIWTNLSAQMKKRLV